MVMTSPQMSRGDVKHEGGQVLLLIVWDCVRGLVSPMIRPHMRFVTAVLLVLTGCSDLQLPDPSSDKPGTLRATFLAPRPNRAEVAPAAGARFQLLGTSIEATADGDGNVLLDGITTSSGQVLASFDADGDGTAELSRSFSLEAVGAGFGKTAFLGTVVLGRRATLQGKVRRGPTPSNTGNTGIQVFVSGTGLVTWTADDGSFVLDGIPAGQVSVTFFTSSFVPVTVAFDLLAGQEARTSELILEPAVPNARAGLRGRVVNVESQGVGDVEVTATDGEVPQTVLTNADGSFAFDDVPLGAVTLILRKMGFSVLRLPNLLVDERGKNMGDLLLLVGDADATGPVTDPGPVISRGDLVSIGAASGIEVPLDGGVWLPPAQQTAPNDLIVLLLNRGSASASISSGRSDWQLLSGEAVGSRYAEIAIRRATVNEANSAALYRFEATDSVAWVLWVFRNAQSITSLSTGKTMGPSAFTLQETNTGARIYDVVASATPRTCTFDPTNDTQTNTNLWASIYWGDQPLRRTASCVDVQTFPNGPSANFQLRVTPQY
jgi:hypothetical protein